MTIPWPETVETLGQALRWLRLDADMSHRQVATAVGQTALWVGDVERGRIEPTDEQLFKLALAYQVNVILLKAMRGKVPKEITEWLKANPDYGRLLRRMKEE